jgi:hypothetical protein
VRGGDWHGVGISRLAAMRLGVNEVGHFGILSPNLQHFKVPARAMA